MNQIARIINSKNGKSINVYCQLDGGSQLTFVSNSGSGFGLKSYDQASFRIETLTGAKMRHANLVQCDLQSLYTDELFSLNNIVTHIPWRNDPATLPHRQNLAQFKHCDDVEMFRLPDIDSVDLLIGNDKAFFIDG